MPAICPDYEFPQNLLDDVGLDLFLRADEALSRLDERARLSQLRAAWSERLLYRNARDAMHAQHCLVYLEDLVLLDGHAFSGAMSPDLSAALGILKLWQAALRADASTVLRAPMPGEMPSLPVNDLAVDPLMVADRPDTFFDADWNEAGRLERWRRVWQDTQRLPALLAGAIVWDAWHVLLPEQRGPWRAPLLAALVLRARAKTRHLLLPIDTGQALLRRGWTAGQPIAVRLRTFLDIVGAAAKHASSELDGLESARERMILKIREARKSSRLGDLIDLMMARPLVSIPLAAKELRMSKQALRLLIPRLGSTPRELTGRRRYRCWTAP